jgi:hypothetical protein
VVVAIGIDVFSSASRTAFIPALQYGVNQFVHERPNDVEEEETALAIVVGYTRSDPSLYSQD